MLLTDDYDNATTLVDLGSAYDHHLRVLVLEERDAIDEDSDGGAYGDDVRCDGDWRNCGAAWHEFHVPGTTQVARGPA